MPLGCGGLMLSWRRHRSAERLTPVPKVPDGMRLYAVGDIHGRADLLEQLLGLIAADAAQHPAQACWLLFLGDYVDRGPQSREVLELLTRLWQRGFAAAAQSADPGDQAESTGTGPPGGADAAADPERAPEALSCGFLMGNHEQSMLHFLADPLGAAQWLEYGGLETLASYGVAAPAPDFDGLMEAGAALRAAVPAHHLAFLEGLELSRQFGDYLFVHAGIRPGVPIEDQEPADLLWIREPFLSHQKPHPLMIVHGHQIRDGVDLRLNRIGIDTGAYATGCLSCLVLDGAERWLIDTVQGGPAPIWGA